MNRTIHRSQKKFLATFSSQSAQAHPFLHHYISRPGETDCHSFTSFTSFTIFKMAPTNINTNLKEYYTQLNR